MEVIRPTIPSLVAASLGWPADPARNASEKVFTIRPYTGCPAALDRCRQCAATSPACTTAVPPARRACRGSPHWLLKRAETTVSDGFPGSDTAQECSTSVSASTGASSRSTAPASTRTRPSSRHMRMRRVSPGNTTPANRVW